jgi:TonB-dependent SusC/RagA subfamily outer membrane receptor
MPVYNLNMTPERWTSIQYRPQDGPNFGNTTTSPFSPVSNPLLDLPVEDIDLVEVVKGAAATALYGAQGTNGVIRISTRRGADGTASTQAPRVRYAGWGGVQQVRQRYDLLDARQYADLINVAAVNNGRPAPYSVTDLSNLRETDWQDEVFRVAAIQSHNLSLNGLTARRTRYYAAADYLRQSGVLINSSLSRYSLRTNLEQQFGSKLTVGVRVAASQLDQRQPGYEPDAGPLLQNILLASPAVPARNATGSVTPDPLRDVATAGHTPRTRRLLAQLQATYQFAPGFSLRLFGSREQALTHDAYSVNYNSPDNNSRILRQDTSKVDSKSWMAGMEMHYQRILRERHTLTANLSYLRQQYKCETSYTQRQETINPNQNGNAFSSLGATSRQELFPTHSPTAALTYAYDGRYELQAALRTDIWLKDNFAPSDSRWFPGGEIRWHIGKEKFLGAVPSLNTLTLKAGAGRTSSSLTTDGLLQPFIIGNNTLVDKPSYDLTTQLDAGLHLSLLQEKLTLDADVYQRRTLGARTVVVATLPGSGSNPSTIALPLGVDLRNRGLELTLGSTWQANSLAGTSRLAVATNHNQVDEPQDQLRTSPVYLGLEEGKAVSSFLLYEQDGIYPIGSARAGQVRLRDQNNDGRIDMADAQYQGTGLPRYTLNFYQQLALKKWQLEAQLDGLFGYQLLNSTLALLDSPTGIGNSTFQALNYWTATNQNTLVPQPGSAAFPSIYQLTSRSLASGNHVRLSQLSISYELLSTGSRKASVWVGGQNLLVTGKYHGYDPNVSSAGASPLYAGRDASVYPVARVWQVGVRGQF